MFTLKWLAVAAVVHRVAVHGSGQGRQPIHIMS